jgi:hypothetical protein
MQNQYGVYDRVREKENEKILKTIREEGLYKFYLKALCSNNRKVIISAQNLIFELGVTFQINFNVLRNTKRDINYSTTQVQQ